MAEGSLSLLMIHNMHVVTFETNRDTPRRVPVCRNLKLEVGMGGANVIIAVLRTHALLAQVHIRACAY